MGQDHKLDERLVYKIRVQGTLDDHWSDWFSSLTITTQEDQPAITCLTGHIDQAALRGVLNKVWDLNLTLISVTLVE